KTVQNVKVVNSAAEPVPVTTQGTTTIAGTVNVGNPVTLAPGATIAGTVNVGNAVSLAPGTSVAITGTPTVSLTQGSSVNISGTPTVQLANNANVSVSNTAATPLYVRSSPQTTDLLFSTPPGGISLVPSGPTIVIGGPLDIGPYERIRVVVYGTS